PKRALELLVQIPREDRIAVMDQELVRMVAWDGFSQLLQRPLCGGMRGHVVMKNPTASYLHHDENIEHPESGRDRNQEVTSDDALRMILDEGSPVVRRRSAVPGPAESLRPVLANGSRRNQNAKLQRQFVGNALFSPNYVLPYHPGDELAYVLGQRWP